MKYIETTENYWNGHGHIIWNIFELCAPEVGIVRFRKICNYILCHTDEKTEFVNSVEENCLYNIQIYQRINCKRFVELMKKKILYIKGVII